jgi:hypothetical protein
MRSRLSRLIISSNYYPPNTWVLVRLLSYVCAINVFGHQQVPRYHLGMNQSSKAVLAHFPERDYMSDICRFFDDVLTPILDKVNSNRCWRTVIPRMRQSDQRRLRGDEISTSR